MERAPGAAAVEHDNEQLSYAELNGKANQLAHSSDEDLEIGPEVQVGICVERQWTGGVAPRRVESWGRLFATGFAVSQRAAAMDAGATCGPGGVGHSVKIGDNVPQVATGKDRQPGAAANADWIKSCPHIIQTMPRHRALSAQTISPM